MAPFVAALGLIDKLLLVAKPLANIPVVGKLIGKVEQVGKNVETVASKTKIGAALLVGAAPDWPQLFADVQTGDATAISKAVAIAVGYALTLYGRGKAGGMSPAGKKQRRKRGPNKPKIALASGASTSSEAPVVSARKRNSREIVGSIESKSASASDSGAA